MYLYERTLFINNISEFDEIIDSLETNENLYFRGQTQHYDFTIPSVLRSKESIFKEDKLYNSALLQDPTLFNEAENNFDRMTLMQHHQYPTRLLDITENPLMALYFAVETNDNASGEIMIYKNKINEKYIEKYALDLGKEYLTNKELNLTNTFSDTVEIDATLSRTSREVRNGFINAVKKFENNKGLINWSNWEKIYQENTFNQEELYKNVAYKDFNENINTQRLYHEILKDVSNFDKIINPLDLNIPRIVKPRIIDTRIKNQRGLFMFVPFDFSIDFENVISITSPADITDDMFLNAKASADRLINMLRFYPVTFDKIVIPAASKKTIRKQLDNRGIDEAFVYPDHAHIAKVFNRKMLH